MSASVVDAGVAAGQAQIGGESVVRWTLEDQKSEQVSATNGSDTSAAEDVAMINYVAYGVIANIIVAVGIAGETCCLR